MGTVCEFEVLFRFFAVKKKLFTILLAVRSDFNTSVTSGVLLPGFENVEVSTIEYVLFGCCM
jgi:hypothetical protein